MSGDRINLINCDQAILKLLLANEDSLAQALQLQIPDPWTEFGTPAFQCSLEQITKAPDTQKWWMYLPVLLSSNTLLGSCGYKGPPDAEGMVEIGYEVATDYRMQGYATEIAQRLITQAYQDKAVRKIQAHTLAEENASVAVLRKCGFVFIEELVDEEDGLIWKWEYTRVLTI